MVEGDCLNDLIRGTINFEGVKKARKIQENLEKRVISTEEVLNLVEY